MQEKGMEAKKGMEAAKGMMQKTPAGAIMYSEIPDTGPLIQFFIDNGLEYSIDDEIATDLVKCWKAEMLVGDIGAETDSGKGSCGIGACGESDGVSGDGRAVRLVGGCALALREGRYICDGIATDPSVRGLRVGEHMLLTMIEEARAQGGDSIYLVARAPGFFAKYGFEAVPREGAPTFFECFSCPQYGASCHPEVMRLMLR